MSANPTTIETLESRLTDLDKQAKNLWAGKKVNADTPALLQLKALTDESAATFARLQALRLERDTLAAFKRSTDDWLTATNRSATLIDLRIRARQLLDDMAVSQTGLDEQVRGFAAAAEIVLGGFTDPQMQAEAQEHYAALNARMVTVAEIARHTPGSQ